jgi:hypothetical protein
MTITVSIEGRESQLWRSFQKYLSCEPWGVRVERLLQEYKAALEAKDADAQQRIQNELGKLRVSIGDPPPGANVVRHVQFSKTRFE